MERKMRILGVLEGIFLAPLIIIVGVSVLIALLTFAPGTTLLNQTITTLIFFVDTVPWIVITCTIGAIVTTVLIAFNNIERTADEDDYEL